MNKQRGMTLISWVIVLGIIAFFTTIAMRLIPMYQEYFSVVQIMESMEVELKENKLTTQQVNLLLAKRFNTGYVSSVKQENITLSRGRDNLSVTKAVIDYEVRKPFIAQISLVGHFHKEIDIEEPKGK
ncbi:MAG: Tfp pilus assembly major pilin PilA [Methylophagaceae bacterium]|jgi:Tfp pilus assembly major pilin PilA